MAARILYADDETEIEFVEVRLRFAGDTFADVFSRKNNKTLRQTLAHRRYTSLAARMMAACQPSDAYHRQRFRLPLS
jgi:hypothetical protein